MKLARSYMRQAHARMGDAKGALAKKNFPYAVRLSQECVELSMKAALRLAGVDYPKVHDVSPLIETVRDRFPDWFSAETAFMKETSALLVAKREPSLYGGETEMLGPDEIIGRNDADDAVRRARKIFELCSRLAASAPRRRRSGLQDHSL